VLLLCLAVIIAASCLLLLLLVSMLTSTLVLLSALLLLLLLLLLLFSAVAVAVGAAADEYSSRQTPNPANLGGRTRGQRPRPRPAGWSEVGDRNKGAFWVASQKQQNHYFCCAKLQIPGVNAISTKQNTDCGSTESRSNSSRIRVKS
jgi:membrane protein implicated in regulation of membrane protease activity